MQVLKDEAQYTEPPENPPKRKSFWCWFYDIVVFLGKGKGKPTTKCNQDVSITILISLASFFLFLDPNNGGIPVASAADKIPKINVSIAFQTFPEPPEEALEGRTDMLAVQSRGPEYLA